jgi:hypothetical protein
MVEVYLAALQGPDRAETQSGTNVAQLSGHSEKPSRVRAQESAPPETPDNPAVQAAGGSPVHTAPAAHPSNDMPEIPDFLKRDRATAQEYFAAG